MISVWSPSRSMRALSSSSSAAWQIGGIQRETRVEPLDLFLCGRLQMNPAAFFEGRDLRQVIVDRQKYPFHIKNLPFRTPPKRRRCFRAGLYVIGAIGLPCFRPLHSPLGAFYSVRRFGCGCRSVYCMGPRPRSLLLLVQNLIGKFIPYAYHSRCRVESQGLYPGSARLHSPLPSCIMMAEKITVHELCTWRERMENS